MGIGTSAGGLAALTAVLEALSADFPFPILVVQHLAADHPSRLAPLLQSRTSVSVSEARVGDRIRGGHAYVAPPDRHMRLGPGGRIRLRRDAPVRFSRPSVDVLFRSLAEVVGARTVAVVLTGAGSDGAEGVRAVHEAGGLVIVQSEASAYNSGMPAATIRTGTTDRILPLVDIAPFLIGLDSLESNGP